MPDVHVNKIKLKNLTVGKKEFLIFLIVMMFEVFKLTKQKLN